MKNLQIICQLHSWCIF